MFEHRMNTTRSVLNSIPITVELARKTQLSQLRLPQPTQTLSPLNVVYQFYTNSLSLITSVLHRSPMKTAIFLATLSTPSPRSQTQNSCTAVAYLGQAAAGGGSCTGQELGDASMRGPGFGACDEVTNGACVLTESSEGDCVIHLYSDSSCATPITGGNTITCGDPFENVNFNSFQVECA
ncbi:hypothetical protein B0H14DRAFT_3158133 [Mycena olivaceomarginata]|nr:hypothetical protein B0H14DRAFT_3158133 [Mycena olivaceomarginata]